MRKLALGAAGLIWLRLWVLPCGFPITAAAQSEQPPTVQVAEAGVPGAQVPGASAGERQPDQQFSGTISGTVQLSNRRAYPAELCPHAAQ